MDGVFHAHHARRNFSTFHRARALFVVEDLELFLAIRFECALFDPIIAVYIFWTSSFFVSCAKLFFMFAIEVRSCRIRPVAKLEHIPVLFRRILLCSWVCASFS